MNLRKSTADLTIRSINKITEKIISTVDVQVGNDNSLFYLNSAVDLLGKKENKKHRKRKRKKKRKRNEEEKNGNEEVKEGDKKKILIRNVLLNEQVIEAIFSMMTPER